MQPIDSDSILDLLTPLQIANFDACRIQQQKLVLQLRVKVHHCVMHKVDFPDGRQHLGEAMAERSLSGSKLRLAARSPQSSDQLNALKRAIRHPIVEIRAIRAPCKHRGQRFLHGILRYHVPKADKIARCVLLDLG